VLRKHPLPRKDIFIRKHTSMERIVEMMSQMSELILLYIVGEYTSGTP